MTNNSISKQRYCNKCSNHKDETDFRLVNGGKNRSNTCNACKYAARKKADVDKGPDELAKKAEWMRQWRAKNPDYAKEQRRKAAEKNGARYRTREERVAEEAIEAKLRRELLRLAVEECDTAKVEHKPWTARGLTEAERYRLRYHLDDDFRAKEKARTRARKEKHGRFAETVRAALRDNKRCPTLEKACGYTLDDLRAHIEGLFVEGMSWEVFFTGALHLDHKKPISLFDLRDPDQLRECWQLSNLQPLWASDNMRKGAKWDGPEVNVEDEDGSVDPDERT